MVDRFASFGGARQTAAKLVLTFRTIGLSFHACAKNLQLGSIALANGLSKRLASLSVVIGLCFLLSKLDPLHLTGHGNLFPHLDDSCIVFRCFAALNEEPVGVIVAI